MSLRKAKSDQEAWDRDRGAGDSNVVPAEGARIEEAQRLPNPWRSLPSPDGEIVVPAEEAVEMLRGGAVERQDGPVSDTYREFRLSEGKPLEEIPPKTPEGSG